MQNNTHVYNLRYFLFVLYSACSRCHFEEINREVHNITEAVIGFVSVVNEYSRVEVSRTRSVRRLPARIGSYHNRLHSVVLFLNVDAEFRPAVNRLSMFCAALRFRTTLDLADSTIASNFEDRET